MGEAGRMLSSVYSASSLAELRRGYDKWAPTYDEGAAELGYWMPPLVAGYFARHVHVDDGTILDAGAGTGMAGASLWVLGFRRLVAIDISDEMLQVARRRRVYSRLEKMTLGEPLGFPDDAFAAFLALAVFFKGHAPADGLDELIRVTRPGGIAVLNARLDTWDEDGLRQKIEELTQAGKWELVEESTAFRPFVLAEPKARTQVFVFRVL